MYEAKSFSGNLKGRPEGTKTHEVVALEFGIAAARTALAAEPKLEEKVPESLYMDTIFLDLHRQLEEAQASVVELSSLEAEVQELLSELPKKELRNILAKAKYCADKGETLEAGQWLGELESRRDWWQNDLTTFPPDFLASLAEEEVALKEKLG